MMLSGFDRPRDQDPVAGACRGDLPPGAAMAEKITRPGDIGEVDDFHPGLALSIEDDHPWSFRAFQCRSRSSLAIEIIA